MYTVRDEIANGLRRPVYQEIRDHQRSVIEEYSSSRKDVFLSAPTGSGKSLTFEAQASQM